MNHYDLRLLRQDGSLICLIRTQCWSDYHARCVVQGMKRVPFDRLEVWRGDVMIHSGREASKFPPAAQSHAVALSSWDRRGSRAAF